MFTLSGFCKCYFFKMLFFVINNLGTPSSKVLVNFGVLQIDTEYSAPESKNISHTIAMFIKRMSRLHALLLLNDQRKCKSIYFLLMNSSHFILCSVSVPNTRCSKTCGIALKINNSSNVMYWGIFTKVKWALIWFFCAIKNDTIRYDNGAPKTGVLRNDLITIWKVTP